VFGLEEEEPGYALLYGVVHACPHTLDLLFEEACSLLEQGYGFVDGEGREKGEPGCELRVLLDRFPQQLAQPAQELNAARLGQPVDGSLRTPALALRLPRHY
jgi:hypothetical protein